MTKSLCIVAALLLAQGVMGQDNEPETIRSTSTLVVVPTLVETLPGELVYGLRTSDFLLTDNGVEQNIALEDIEHQPLAVVVVLQTGGAAPRQFQNYRGLPAMLDQATAGFPGQFALVTFDSRPEDASDFTQSAADLKGDLTHLQQGDSGAAILDAVNYGIGLLDTQPAGTRKILVLVSQTHDDGSKVKPEDIVRRLVETNTIVCSMTFSPEKQWLKDQFTHERHENPPYEFPPGIVLMHTFNLDAPVRMALQGIRSDTAAEIAKLSGGESLQFGNARDLDRQLSVLANHLPNRYTLTFRPSSGSRGLHSLRVQVLHQPEPVDVKAREAYWVDEPK